MRRIEEVINLVTCRKRNMVLTSIGLLMFGFIIGFVGIKLA